MADTAGHAVGNPRGRRLLWAVPVVIAVQQLIIALPGDDMRGGPWAFVWFLVVVALTWAAAMRRSSLAWTVLLGFAVLALTVSLFVGIEGDYGPAGYPYLLLSGLALYLLLAPATLDHMRS